MTFEARLGFIAFFLFCWCVFGLIPWAGVAVSARGRGALLALPLALTAACATGIAIPLLGQRDAAGYFLSLGTAFIGGALGSLTGIYVARRVEASRPAKDKPVVDHPIGAHRPAPTPPETPTATES
ncbi:MAG: hypothetical protein ABI559_00525 [Chloroflexota bacterium]